MAMLGLLAGNGATTGAARYRGDNLLEMDSRALNKIRGDRIAMIFQDPMTSLNPFLTIERQMTETLQLHRKLSRKSHEARDRGARIGADPGRGTPHPHVSARVLGRHRQRVMIAMALLSEPEILIADEPTTALDVTVQAQIIDLLRELNRERGTAIVLITHDMGVVAGLADDVMVMYAGRTVEYAPAESIFAAPSHPYTIGLLNALPRLTDADDAPLVAIPGNPPMPGTAPAGCAFAKRCTYAEERCGAARPRSKPMAPQARCARATVRWPI